MGFAVAAAVVCGAAFARYGTAWLHAFGPLARNANRETEWSLPHRLEQLGVPRALAIALFAAAFFAVYAWLARDAWQGRARLALATCALLLALPYLVVWDVVWALPLAAAEDDEPAAVLSLALCAYLLRQTVPL
jgi:cytochrome c oxidase assembly factor CtaG